MSENVIKPRGGAGRTPNSERIKNGELIVSKRCKVCQSPVADDITRDLISGVPGVKIIEKYQEAFPPDAPLNAVNLTSHKKHMAVDLLVRADRVSAIQSSPILSAPTKSVMLKQYTDKFDKQTTTDSLYSQRLENLLHIQREIDSYNQQEQLAPLSAHDIASRRTLIQDLEVAYRGFNQDLLKHIQLEADIFTKQISLQYVAEIKSTFLEFTKKFIDIIVREIPDQQLRTRIVENLTDLLDTIVAPKLDPRAAINADYEEIGTETPSKSDESKTE